MPGLSLLRTFVNMTDDGVALTATTNLPSMDSVGMDGSHLDEDCNDGSCYTPYSERPETYVVPVIFVVIFAVGVVGNGTLIMIFCRHRAMRNIPNT